MSAEERIAPVAPAPAGPPIAVVLATRNRAEGAASAARAILASAHPAFVLCIVDQSDGESTREALRDVMRDARVRVIASPARGLAAARNIGVSQCGAPIVAFTDDDCAPESGWLLAFAEAFGSSARIGIVFGSVIAADFDRGAGFIPAYRVVRARTVRSLSSKASVEGIGACMAVRRSTWEALGGFDESLGAGTALCAGEDTDFMVRTLIAGGEVHETPDARVTHFGFRSWEEGRSTIAGYMRGLGAVHAKMLRLAGLRALRPTVVLAWRWLARSPVVDLNHRPPQLKRLAAFLRGAWSGMRTPLERPGGHFRPTEPGPPAAKIAQR